MSAMKSMPLAEYLKAQIYLSRKTQTAVAKEVGYNPNVVAMIANGKTRLPLNKVYAFAQALNLDPYALMRMALAEYEPQLWEVIRASLQNLVITEKEGKLVQAVRKGAGVSEGTEIDFTDEELEQIAAIARKAAQRNAHDLQEQVNKMKEEIGPGPRPARPKPRKQPPAAK